MKKLCAVYADQAISKDKNKRKKDYIAFLCKVAEEVGLNETKIRKISLKEAVSILQKIAPCGCEFSEDEFGYAGFKIVEDKSTDEYYEEVVKGENNLQ